MKWKIKTVKKTFSINSDLLDFLDNQSNKSQIVNDALRLIKIRKGYENEIERKAKIEMLELDKFMLKHNIEHVSKDDPDYKVFEQARKNPNPEYYTLEEMEKEFNLWS